MKIIPVNLLQLSLVVSVAMILGMTTTAHAGRDNYYERGYSRDYDRGDNYAYRRHDRNKYRKYRKHRKYRHAHKHSHHHSHRYDRGGYIRSYNNYRRYDNRFPQPRYNYRPNHYTQIIYPAAPTYYRPRANVVFGVDTGHASFMFRY